MELVTEYSGTFNRISQTISGDPESMRVLILMDDGSVREIFRGDKYDRKVFLERMAEEKRSVRCKEE